MSETEPIVVAAGPSRPAAKHSIHDGINRRGGIAFNREELSQILNVYGRKVRAANGATTPSTRLREKAVFSVFRRTTEVPLYRIEKAPKLSRRQGAYSVIAATGLILKRGHDLARVLRALDRGLRLVEC